MKRLNVVISEFVHRELKMAAFCREVTVADVITRLIAESLLAAGAVVAAMISSAAGGGPLR